MDALSFTNKAWEEYLEWAITNKRIIDRINALIKDIQRNGFMSGIGKPEALRGSKNYSRRINEEHRLIYTGDEKQNLLIVSCKGHYGY
ncbi:Txe/YoeB family addiction module toxin [Synergistales bacterium]|nr:Txe/YoeB family addiction module toxin [Synergistales bacterium]